MATRSIFKEKIKTQVPNKNAFNLDNEVSFTFPFGQLTPILFHDVIPSDQFRVRSNVLLKLPPLFAPIMSRLDCMVHYFFVRYNTVWRRSAGYGSFDDWFADDPGQDNTTYGMKYVTINNTTKSYFAKNTLADYMGLPVSDNWGTVTQDIDISALPFLAYQLIWDEYYRDQVLQTNLEDRSSNQDIYQATDDDLTANIQHVIDLQYVNYEKDYFTSALTTAYAGTASDVVFDQDVYGTGYSKPAIVVKKSGGTAPTAGAVSIAGSNLQSSAAENLWFHTDAGYNLAAEIEITELRRAEALMRYYEFSGRAGRRYNEHMLGLFGVITDDAKRVIPQYLGGGRVNIEFTEVVSQAETLVPSSDAVSTPLGGPLAGHAQGAGSAGGFSHTFNEHGCIIGVMFVRPRTAYKEGIDRFWRKMDREDFYNPYLQHIGDQAILQSEIFYDDTGTDADDVFGYAPRWAEYKWAKNYVAGEMNYQESMDHWTMAQFYGSPPSLNESFIMVSPARDEFSRIYSVSGLDQIYANVYNQVTAIRPMDRHDIGGNVQH